jgi:probable rRNA maturation factor
LRVHIVTHGVRHAIPRGLLERAAAEAMGAIGCGSGDELEVALVDDARIARLNRRHLAHRGSTDVLSFPGPRRPGAVTSGDPVIGEIVISVDRARAQARSAGWPVRCEVALLLVHGVLHLGGFTDHTPAAAARMRAREHEVLARVFGSRR